jgi:hypothetical protein
MSERIGKWSAVLAATSLMTIGAASVARAQERIEAKVPFAFIVHGVKLPAGSYTVTEDANLAGVCRIASTDGHHAIYVMTTAVDDRPDAQPELWFKKFGDQYFLSRVVSWDGEEREIVLTKSIMEHELTEVAAADNP